MEEYIIKKAEIYQSYRYDVLKLARMASEHPHNIQIITMDTKRRVT